MTVVEHLGELRRRLMISIVAVVVGGDDRASSSPRRSSGSSSSSTTTPTDGHARHADLHRPARRVRDPAEDRDLRRHRARAAGVALPAVALHHPGPEPQGEEVRGPVRRRVDRPVRAAGRSSRCSPSSRRCDFLLNVGGSDLQPLLTADKYISLVSLMIVAFGMSFEFPVVLVFLLHRPGAHDRAAARTGAARPSSCIVAFAARDHAEPGPVLAVRDGGADVPVLRERRIIIGRILKR